MKSISLCMIVKNEEAVLRKCLSSILGVVDEIIIVDTGSTDNTIEIAKEYTHQIYSYKWDNDFANARNFSLLKASKDYILWLDADDYLLKEDCDNLMKIKESNEDIDMYYFLYDYDKNYMPFYRERLFKNNGKYLFKGKVHEAIIPFGNIKYLNIVIYQQEKKSKDISRNLKIYETININEYTSRDYYYYGKELFRNKKYKKSLKILKKFLTMNHSYIEDNIDACFYVANIYIITSDNNKALKYLFLSFIYDLPRANILCKIADIYLMGNDYHKAIFYYKLALTSKNNFKGFIHKDYLGYYPNLKLCICYDLLKEYCLANSYNEQAYKYKIKDDIYFHNKQYFSGLIK